MSEFIGTVPRAATPPGFQTTPHWLFVKGRGVRVLVPRWWIITVELLGFGLGFAVRGLW
jgi:hypothetical protein